MDTLEALKEGRLDEALASVKDAIRKSPTDGRPRSVLFQLLCVQGNWEAAQAQLKLVGDFDVEASLWVGVCEKLMACEAARKQVFEGKQAPTLFGKPPEWVGGMIEAFRLGLEGQWQAAAVSQAKAMEAAPATAVTVNNQSAEWIADADSRLGPMLEAYVEGKYYWIPFEHVREVSFRSPTHFMDSIWAPVDFEWPNEGKASGYIPVRYFGSEKSPDPLIQLGRRTDWEQKAEHFYVGQGHRMLTTSEADHSLLDLRLIKVPSARADSFASEPPATEETADHSES